MGGQALASCTVRGLRACSLVHGGWEGLREARPSDSSHPRMNNPPRTAKDAQQPIPSRPAGLLRVVRTRCATHSDTDERKLAQALLRKWQPPEPAGGSTGSRPGSAQASQAGGPSRPPSRAPQQQVPGAASQQRGSQSDLAAYLDEETARRLEEIQQRKAAAEAEAERLRQEAAAAEAAAAQQPGPSRGRDKSEPRITSFEVRVGCWWLWHLLDGV